jgi:hypothetical protein
MESLALCASQPKNGSSWIFLNSHFSRRKALACPNAFFSHITGWVLTTSGRSSSGVCVVCLDLQCGVVRSVPYIWERDEKFYGACSYTIRHTFEQVHCASSQFSCSFLLAIMGNWKTLVIWGLGGVCLCPFFTCFVSELLRGGYRRSCSAL